MNFRILIKKAILVTEKGFQHHKTQAQDVFAYRHFNTLLIVEVRYLFFGGSINLNHTRHLSTSP